MPCGIRRPLLSSIVLCAAVADRGIGRMQRDTYELSERQRGVERAKSFAIVRGLRDAAVIGEVILVRISGREGQRVLIGVSRRATRRILKPGPDVVEITRKIRPA